MVQCILQKSLAFLNDVCKFILRKLCFEVPIVFIVLSNNSMAIQTIGGPMLWLLTKSFKGIFHNTENDRIYFVLYKRWIGIGGTKVIQWRLPTYANIYV